MELLIDLLTSAYNIGMNIKILGIPFIVWIIIPLLIGLLVDFIKGKKS